jgi:hypothetical protein
LNINTRPEVIRRGVFDMQVCVPEEFTDEQVLEFATRENPSGTESGWQIRRSGDPLLAGAPSRMPCSAREGCVHVVLDA